MRKIGTSTIPADQPMTATECKIGVLERHAATLGPDEHLHFSMTTPELDTPEVRDWFASCASIIEDRMRADALSNAIEADDQPWLDGQP